MSTPLCRLCAQSDESNIVVLGGEKLKNLLPLRIQEFLGLDILSELSKSIAICSSCQVMVETIEHFFCKVQAGQQIWVAIHSNVDKIEAKKQGYVPRPKRREAKLVPFLVRALDTGQFRGLLWEDRSLGLFRLPWPRQGTNKWKPEDSQLFKEWAILKGRYSEKEDFVLWKTCIRTSLHKLPNVREVRELHNFTANPPYKVYCITDFPDSYLASSKAVQMDHNYTREDEDGEGVSDMRAITEDGEKIDIQVAISKLHAEGQTTNVPIGDNPLSSTSRTVAKLLRPLSMPINSHDDDKGSDGSETMWYIAQEETIGEEPSGNTAAGRALHQLVEIPPQETVARWIEQLKCSMAKRGFGSASSVPPKKRRRGFLKAGDVRMNNAVKVIEKVEHEKVEDVADDDGELTDGESDVSLHLSTSDEGGSQADQDDTFDNPYVCGSCQIEFEGFEQLRHHLDLHVSGKLKKPNVIQATQSSKPSTTRPSKPSPVKRTPATKTTNSRNTNGVGPPRTNAQPKKPVRCYESALSKRRKLRQNAKMAAAAAAAAAKSVPSSRPVRQGASLYRRQLRTATPLMTRRNFQTTEKLQGRECATCHKTFASVGELVKHRDQCPSPTSSPSKGKSVPTPVTENVTTTTEESVVGNQCKDTPDTAASPDVDQPCEINYVKLCKVEAEDPDNGD